MTTRKNISISFEIFPPNTPKGFQQIEETCTALHTLDPDFFSVTFGAGGASQLKTQHMVGRLVQKNITTMPHISCIHMTHAHLKALLEKYRLWGINRLLVVRGDSADNPNNVTTDFKYASELIQHIRLLHGDYFHIVVAAYPEFHPQSKNSVEDLYHFKRKIEAGANSAITQFFFNSDAYFRFKESCAELGIHIPIVPGIMPIHDYEKLMRISQSCGAEIPLWLRKRLESCADDHFSIHALGRDLMITFCEKLLRDGADGLHFYTLNQIDPVKKICQNLFYQNTSMTYSDHIAAYV